jgi:hypothetical protein
MYKVRPLCRLNILKCPREEESLLERLEDDKESTHGKEGD